METPTYKLLFLLNIITLEEKTKDFSETTTILSEHTCYSKSLHLVQLAPLSPSRHKENTLSGKSHH